MRVAIMQPYFFPYIGYWQLIHAVDTFVVYDDVNFIKGGWINRNYILGQSSNKLLLTLQLIGASPNLLINQIKVGNNKKKLIESIRHSYSRSPQFKYVFPLIEHLINYQEDNLANYLTYLIKNIINFFEFKTTVLVSSQFHKDNFLRGQDKVIEICKVVGANIYINSPGGRLLYDNSTFAENGLELQFIAPQIKNYHQFNDPFLPNLSVIDFMMFNSKESCINQMGEYLIERE